MAWQEYPGLILRWPMEKEGVDMMRAKLAFEQMKTQAPMRGAQACGTCSPVPKSTDSAM